MTTTLKNFAALFLLKIADSKKNGEKTEW